MPREVVYIVVVYRVNYRGPATWRARDFGKDLSKRLDWLIVREKCSPMYRGLVAG